MRALVGAGLVLDFLVFERHLPSVLRALEATPGLRAVIDHVAKPNLRGGDLRSWRAGLSQVARHENIYCKLSGLVTEADPARLDAALLAPVVEHALAVFGEDRLIFGSDWPVCTLAASYERVLELLRAVLGNQSAAFERKLFGDNARRLYGIVSSA
ncbi:MAG: amidohydrolase family protein [Polyangiaceae bacterium]